MPLQQFPEAELQAKAVQLGLVQEGQAIPTAAMASKVKAAIVEDRRAAKRQGQPATEPVCAKEIVVQPGGAVLIDGEPFPWLIAKQSMEIGLDPEPGGISTVRLTLLAESVQVIKPEKSQSKESE